MMTIQSSRHSVVAVGDDKVSQNVVTRTQLSIIYTQRISCNNIHNDVRKRKEKKEIQKKKKMSHNTEATQREHTSGLMGLWFGIFLCVER
jgi:hypothetical protein